MTVYDIVAREGKKPYAISLPDHNSPHAIILDIEDDAEMKSPLAWFESTQDTAPYASVKIVGPKDELRVERYVRYDILSYSNKNFIGKLITKPWTLRPLVLFADLNSSRLMIFDLEHGQVREINVDSDSVLVFETALCGGITEDRVIINERTRGHLYSISGLDEIKIVTSLEIPHTSLYSTTAWGTTFTTKRGSLASLSASGYYVNCYGRKVKLMNAMLDVREVLLDERLMALIPNVEGLGPMNNVDEFTNVKVILLKLRGQEMDMARMLSRRYIWMEGWTSLVDINARYLMLYTNSDDIVVVDKEGVEVDVPLFDSLTPLPDEFMFHPDNENEIVYINDRGKVSMVEIA